MNRTAVIFGALKGFNLQVISLASKNCFSSPISVTRLKGAPNMADLISLIEKRPQPYGLTTTEIEKVES